MLIRVINPEMNRAAGKHGNLDAASDVVPFVVIGKITGLRTDFTEITQQPRPGFLRQRIQNFDDFHIHEQAVGHGG